jgi:hypothetical protein
MRVAEEQFLRKKLKLYEEHSLKFRVGTRMEIIVYLFIWQRFLKCIGYAESTGRIIMNGQLKITWKEAVLPYPSILLKALRRITKGKQAG